MERAAHEHLEHTKRTAIDSEIFILFCVRRPLVTAAITIMMGESDNNMEWRDENNEVAACNAMVGEVRSINFPAKHK